MAGPRAGPAVTGSVGNCVAPLGLAELYTFLDASSFTMASNTPYALVLSSDSSTIKWGGNGVSSTTPTASAGFAYDAFLQSTNAGGSWTATSIATNNAVAISVVPEPSQLALLAMGAVGSWWAFRGRGRRRDGRRSTDSGSVAGF
jgi:hypothetical protein